MSGGNDDPDTLMELVDFTDDFDGEDLRQYLREILAEDWESSEGASTSALEDSTTSSSFEDASSTAVWPEGSIVTNSPYFRCSIERRNEKYMIRVNWTEAVLSVVPPEGGILFDLLSAELSKGKGRYPRRQIRVRPDPNNRTDNNREECYRYAANFSQFLDQFFNRDPATLLSDLKKYDAVITNAINRERTTNEDRVRTGLRPKANHTLSFDVMIAIFETRDAVNVPTEDLKPSGSPMNMEESDEMAEILRNISEMKLDISDLKAAVFPEEDCRKRPRPMGDLAAHESVKPGAVAKMHQNWCKPGRVIGQYRRGVGPLRHNRVPLQYKVISTRPSDLEAPQVGVNIAHQVRTVTVRLSGSLYGIRLLIIFEFSWENAPLSYTTTRSTRSLKTWAELSLTPMSTI